MGEILHEQILSMKQDKWLYKHMHRLLWKHREGILDQKALSLELCCEGWGSGKWSKLGEFQAKGSPQCIRSTHDCALTGSLV